MGGAALEAALRKRLGLGADQHESKEGVALEGAYCFGACACAPSAMINGELHGRLDVARVLALLQDDEVAP
jgi:formate dehydrogenase subunit gamma